MNTLDPGSAFPDPASALVDRERREQFAEEGAHFESAYLLTLQWMLPAENAARAEGWLFEGRSSSGLDPNELVAGFIDRSARHVKRRRRKKAPIAVLFCGWR